MPRHPLPPALALHHRSGHRYELSGLRTASIRDQILRAHLLVHGLHMLPDGDFDRTLPVLVVGAGAAGLEAALTLQSLGQPVVLVEERPQPFFHQRYVTTRVIDPREYDFPAANWRLGDMDDGSGVVPFLAFQSDKPSQLALRWDQALTAAEADARAGVATEFRFIGGRRLDVADLATNGALETWSQYEDDFGAISPRDFAAVISTVGFQSEMTSLPTEAAPEVVCRPFWDQDTLLDPDLGTGGRVGQGASRAARVLVSGGGDGASQDVQRALTGLCGKALFDALDITLPSDSLLAAVLQEHASQRAHLWSAWRLDATAEARSAAWNWRPDASRAYGDWHAAFETLATDVFTSWGAEWTTRAALLRREVDLTWLVGAPWLTYQYGLNRLLALLVTRLRAEQTGALWAAHSSATLKVVMGSAFPHVPLVIYGARVSRVTHVGHAAPADRKCALEEHEIACAFDDGTSHDLGVYDVLVARHGIDIKRLFGGAAIPEQLVPYDLPR